MSGLTIIATTVVISVTACFVATKSSAQGIRIIVEDFDAILKPVTNAPTDPNAIVLVERKLYQDGDKKLSLKCRKLGLPNGAEIEFFVNGQKIGQTDVRNGSGRFVLKSASGDEVPEITVGDTAEVRYKNNRIMEGTFYKD